MPHFAWRPLVAGRSRASSTAINSISHGPLRRARLTSHKTAASCRILLGDRWSLVAAVHPARQSTQNAMDYFAVHVGQPEVAALVGVGQPQMVDAHQVQNRGVEVVHMHLLVRRHNVV